MLNRGMIRGHFFMSGYDLDISQIAFTLTIESVKPIMRRREQDDNRIWIIESVIISTRLIIARYLNLFLRRELHLQASTMDDS